jgi:hypothetical protein
LPVNLLLDQAPGDGHDRLGRAGQHTAQPLHHRERLVAIGRGRAPARDRSEVDFKLPNERIGGSLVHR